MLSLPTARALCQSLPTKKGMARDGRSCWGKGGGKQGASKSQRLAATVGAQQPGQRAVKVPTPEPPRPALVIEVSLELPNGHPLQIKALLDSGSSCNFMSKEFAAEHQIQTIPLSNPLQVTTIDGRELLGGEVSQQTVPMIMRVARHTEPIAFNVATLGGAPIILGMSWLALHDPLVGWHQRVVSFGSAYCLEHCKQGKVPGGAGVTLAGMEVMDKGKVPPQYADLSNVFSEREADKLPPHRPFDCQINLLPGAQLPVGKLYAMSDREMQELREFIDKNLKRGFIRESRAVGGSPVFFVDKKNADRPRLVVDFRALNAVSEPLAFPMPRIDDLLTRVRKGKIFTKLDLRGAYNLIRIRKGDEWKTTMFTPLGAFEYLVMPFGLQAGSACFQAFMNHVLGPLLYKNCVAFLDDVLVYSEDEEQHVKDVREVLGKLQANQLWVKLEKCQFHTKEVEFLGYRLSDKGLAMDPGKVQAVLEWKTPKTKKDVQRFLGFGNFYRKFIKNFAHLTAPITDCLSSKKKFVWTAEAERAFEELKRAFASEEQLLHVDLRKPMRVETDASDRAIGAVLLQPGRSTSEWRPCAFFSRKLNKSERNYTVYDRELLAIHEAFRRWRHLLIGAQHKVQVCTDHKNLEYWRTARVLNQRQVRWAQEFSKFHFEICYVPGPENVREDALSRKPEYLEGEGAIEERHVIPEDRWVCGAVMVGQRELVEETENDEYAQDKLRGLRGEGESPGGFEERNGALYYKGALYIPEGELRGRILKQLHDSPTAGHFGQHKTMWLVTREFWWPKVREDVKEYVRGCDQCQRAKGERRAPAGLLEPLPTPERPWEAVSIDFMTDLPKSKGKTAIMVVVDLLTKMCHFVACSHAVTAEETAKLFVEHIFRLHGAPLRVISDRGKQFTSRFWRKLMSLLHVEVNFSTARHPETNGQAERANGILQQYLRCYVNDRENDWVEKLALAEFAYNNAENVSTGMSPFLANYGCHPRAFPGEGGERWSVPAAEHFVEEMEAIHHQLQLNLERAKAQYKKQADKNRREGETIRVGDQVWLSTQGLPFKGGCKKLRPKRLGPFEVIQQVNPVAFKLRLPNHMKLHPVFHRSLLSPYRGGREGEHARGPALEERERSNHVAEILDSRWKGNQVEYLVAWEGEPESENTWVTAGEVNDEVLTETFHRRFPRKPQPVERFRREYFGTTDEEQEMEGFAESDLEEGIDSDDEEYRETRDSSRWRGVFKTSDDDEGSFRGFTSSQPGGEETGGGEGGPGGEVDVRELPSEGQEVQRLPEVERDVAAEEGTSRGRAGTSRESESEGWLRDVSSKNSGEVSGPPIGTPTPRRKLSRRESRRRVSVK
uniref:Gypsy retrotransposon integrase-like protein 1 n=1 Tax=Podarcis muralis TaxID=64176 RepID=A0A670IL45_PODMU